MTDLVVAALVLGSVYGLLGAAVAVTAVATRTLHLAVGEVLVAGVLLEVLVGVDVVTSIPTPLVVLAALAVGAALSALLEPLVLCWLPGGAPVLVGIALVAGVLDALTVRAVGARTYRPTAFLDLPDVGGIPGSVVSALVFGGLGAAVLGIALARTRWGRRVRLAGSAPEAAPYFGITPARTRAAALAVTGAAAVLAGLLVTPVTFVGAGQGAGFTIRGVAAALILGRVGPFRAIVAGLALGFAEAVALSVWPGVGSGVFVGLVVIVVLVARGSEEERAWGRAW